MKVVTDQFKPEMELHAGARLPVRAVVWLGALAPEDVDVQLHVGTAGGESVFKEGRSVSMKQESRMGDSYVYAGEIQCSKSGRHDFSVRVIGRHPDAVNALMPLFIKWSDE